VGDSMKRLIIHLLVSAVTFTLGITGGAVFKRQGAQQLQTQNAVKSIASAVKPAQVIADISTPEYNVIWDYDVDRFNPRGDYYILGRKPKAFSEFDGVELSVYPGDAGPIGSVSIQIVVNRTYEGQQAVSGLVTEHGLSFKTTAITDTQCDYAFDGYFLRTGVLFKAGKHEAVLEGQLIKSKNGVRLAAAKVRFRVEYLGC
jgi:hypothetical protein